MICCDSLPSLGTLDLDPMKGSAWKLQSVLQADFWVATTGTVTDPTVTDSKQEEGAAV